MMFDTRAITAAILATMSLSNAFQPTSVGNGISGRSNILNNSRLHMSTQTAKKLPGTAEMDTPWEDLGFEFRPTNSHVKLTWKEGEGWSKPELVEVRIVVQFYFVG